jgi:hypothetical protein
MPASETPKPGPGPRIVVVDSEVPQAGWHQVQLATLPAMSGANRPGPVSAQLVPATRGALIAQAATRRVPRSAEVPIRAGMARGLGRVRVPDAAMVSIRSVGFSHGSHLGAGAFRSANDNGSAGRAPARRSVWREVFFLLVLILTVAGAFWSGRLHASYKVIVVPGPSSFYSVVT